MGAFLALGFLFTVLSKRKLAFTHLHVGQIYLKGDPQIHRKHLRSLPTCQRGEAWENDQENTVIGSLLWLQLRLNWALKGKGTFRADSKLKVEELPRSLK